MKVVSKYFAQEGISMKREPVLNYFENLLAIPAASKHEEEIISFVASELTALECDLLAVGEGGIIACLKGNSTDYPALFLNAHLDTHVSGIPEFKVNSTYYQAQAGSLGADDKAGIAAILAAIYELKTTECQHGDIELIFTTGEEVGLLGIKMLDLTLLKAKFGYTIDAPSAIGTFQSKSETHLSIIFHIKQDFTESRLSAIQIARASLHAYKMQKFPRGVAVSFDEFTGEPFDDGTECLTAKLCVVSSFQVKEVLDYVEDLKDCFYHTCEKYGAQISAEVKANYQGYHLEENQRSLLLFKQAAKKQKLATQEVFHHGGSDANILNERGFKALLVGAGYEDPHTPSERISRTSLIQLTRLITQIAQSARGIGTLSYLPKN